MKKIIALAVVGFTSQAITGFAGEPVVPSKEVVTPPAPIQELYRANEWQLDLFGAYAPAGGKGSRFLGDHAWGGGADVNYFFTKYLGLGLEGDVLRGTGVREGDVSGQFALNALVRYPIGNTGWAPYAFAGIGGFVPGDNSNFANTFSNGFRREFRNRNNDDILLEGHWGAGLEYRFTRHIGVFADGRYEVVDQSRNNFGMIRTGVRFAF